MKANAVLLFASLLFASLPAYVLISGLSSEPIMETSFGVLAVVFFFAAFIPRRR